MPHDSRQVNWPVTYFPIHQNHNNLWDNGGHSLMITRQMPTTASNVFCIWWLVQMIKYIITLQDFSVHRQIGLQNRNFSLSQFRGYTKSSNWQTKTKPVSSREGLQLQVNPSRPCDPTDLPGGSRSRVTFPLDDILLAMFPFPMRILNKTET